MAGRELRDPIHGFIYLDDLEAEIIDLPIFQRLRNIKQLALAGLVYPGAMHTRFDHSLGAMHISGKIANVIDVDPSETRLVRLAALLHDIGHGPFSHVSEPVLEAYYDREKVQLKGTEQIHESLTRAIILEDESLGYLLSQKDRDCISGLLDGSYGDSVLKAIVSGPLDADKQDYLLRDSHFCGVKYGVYDIDRLSATLAIHKDSDDRYLAITGDGVHALEQFVLAKYYMTTQVYRHKVRLITDSMIRRALELGISVDGIEWLGNLYTYTGSEDHIQEYKAWTDDRLTNEILSDRTPDGYAKSLFQNLVARRLHKQIATYPLLEFSDPLVRDAITELNADGRAELERRIGNYLSVDENLVIVHTFSIKSVREQSRNSEASILVLTPEAPKEFEQVSTLFRSINEAIQEQYIEVYAPLPSQSERDKKKLRTQYQGEIRELISKVVTENLMKKEA